MSSKEIAAELGIPQGLRPLHQIAKTIGVPNATLLREARAGRLKTLQIGARLFASSASVREYLEPRA
jgi:hypothetical protein